VDLIVCTDAEEILGIGDWGGGRHPDRGRQAGRLHRGGGHRPAPGHPGCRWDVGTDKRGPAERPRCTWATGTPGSAAPITTRSSGGTWKVASELFPDALLHFEDFGPGKRAGGYWSPTGTSTGSSTTTCRAPARSPWPPRWSALKVHRPPDARAEARRVRPRATGGRWHRRPAPRCHGPRRRGPRTRQRAQVWLVDKQGLLTSDMTGLRDYQEPYARDPAEVKGWASGRPRHLAA